jgi:predicted TIM-barrel fold metal-dependent hydrolase
MRKAGPTRRAMLGMTLTLPGFLGGCDLFRSYPTFPCPDDPLTSDPTAPLTIDTHAHVYSGSDFQIAPFFRHIVAQGDHDMGVLAEVLEAIDWNIVPTAKSEMSVLNQVADALRYCSSSFSHDRLIASLKEAAYRTGVDQLSQGLSKVQAARRPFGAEFASERVANRIRTLPRNYRDFRSLVWIRRKTSRDTRLDGAFAFVLRNFQHRYVNVVDYLAELSRGRKRKVDLIVAHLVDYDFPLAEGKPTSTSLADQVDIMREISILTRGRVHCFAPFDPIKEVAFRLGKAPESPLALVKRAVTQSGFIGVKLYPPMGFAPLDNVRHDVSWWSGSLIPKALLVTQFPELLDSALRDLYGWCLEEDVPIMSHAAPSHSPSEKFKKLTNPSYWGVVFRAENFPDLSVDFGYLGDCEPAANKGQRAKKFAKLMTESAGGSRAYADSACFSEAITSPPALKDILAHLYRSTARASAPLAQRLMYGTDWAMITLEGQASERYLDRFNEIFEALDEDGSLGTNGSPSDNFFGWNAVNYLGLMPDRGNRTRLNSFYRGSGVPTPQWMRKVDGMKVVAKL